MTKVPEETQKAIDAAVAKVKEKYEADIEKLKSGFDRKLSEAKKVADDAQEKLTAAEGELAEFRLGQDDPKALERMKDHIVELTNDLKEANKKVEALEAEKGDWESDKAKTELASKRSEIAKEYEVEEEKVKGDSEAEMRQAAADAKIANLKEGAGPKAPPRKEHEAPKVTGAGGEEKDDRPPRAIYAEVTREKREGIGKD